MKNPEERRSRGARQLVLPEHVADRLRAMHAAVPRYQAGSAGQHPATVEFTRYAALVWLRGWNATTIAHTIGASRQGVHRHIKRTLAEDASLRAVVDASIPWAPENAKEAARRGPRRVAGAPSLPPGMAEGLRQLRAAAMGPSGAQISQYSPEVTSYRMAVAATCLAGWSSAVIARDLGLTVGAINFVVKTARKHHTDAEIRAAYPDIPAPPWTGGWGPPVSRNAARDANPTRP